MVEIGGKKPTVVIVGAGLAVLAAGRRLHYCSGNIIDIVVVNDGDRIGGRILISGALIPDDSLTALERMDGFPTDDLPCLAVSMTSSPSSNTSSSTEKSMLKLPASDNSLRRPVPLQPRLHVRRQR